MGSCAGDGEWPGGVTGADAEVGALVWVRRRNGSWWPGRILGMDELPENCVIPPRSAGTPIKLLGRADGSIDWYNLEKSKRVKSFRCGEYDECIEKAKAQACYQKRTQSEGRYVRREDAILHALEIERSRLPNNGDDSEEGIENNMHASRNMYSGQFENINGFNKRSSCNTRGSYSVEENSTYGLSQALTVYKRPQNTSSSSTRYASSSKRKRKGQKDFEDDTTKGFQRMRDLREIGTKDAFRQKSCIGISADGQQDVPLLESGPSFAYDFSNSNGIKDEKQSHSSIKKKRSNIGQSYENLRKKDRHRPLSKLCEDSEAAVPTYCHWGPSGQSSSQYLGDQMSSPFQSSRPKTFFSSDVNSCSYSSGASCLEMLLDTSHTNHRGAANVFAVNDAEVSYRTRFPNDYSDGDEFFDSLPIGDGVLEEGHLNDEISKVNNQTTDGDKAGISSNWDPIISKKKSVGSVTLVSKESHKQDQHVLLQQYEGAIKLDGIVYKPTGLENNMRLATPELDESSETISNHSNSEMGTSPPYFVPLQVILPEQQPDLKPSRCHVTRPTKRARADHRLYDVELNIERSYTGHTAPLVSLMSKWTGKPIVGYPVAVEVLEDSRPAASRNERPPAVGSLDSILKSRPAEPRQARSSHASRSKSKSKSSGRKKVSENDLDKSWRPHTKKPASSPRKMRSLSSFGSSRRESAHKKRAAAKTSEPTIACVPLRLVFSRINEALSFPVRQENPT